MANTDWKSIALRLLEAKGARADKMTSSEPDYGSGVTDYENYGTGVSEEAPKRNTHYYGTKEGIEAGPFIPTRWSGIDGIHRNFRPQPGQKSIMMRNTPSRDEEIGVLLRLLAMLQGGR